MGGGEATVKQLYREPKKAELVNGELVVMTPGGGTHAYAAGRIVASLLVYSDCTGSRGEQADAEPAVPGWSMPVDELFPQTSG